jgi:hypothetical protein
MFRSKKYVYMKSTTVYVPSPRRNWDSPNPSLARGGGGGHTRLRVKGWGSLKSDDWRKSLAPCLLCDSECQLSAEENSLPRSALPVSSIKRLASSLLLMSFNLKTRKMYYMLSQNESTREFFQRPLNPRPV